MLQSVAYKGWGTPHGTYFTIRYFITYLKIDNTN